MLNGFDDELAELMVQLLILLLIGVGKHEQSGAPLIIRESLVLPNPILLERFHVVLKPIAPPQKGPFIELHLHVHAVSDRQIARIG